MANSLAEVSDGGLWRGHLKVKGKSPVPSDREYDMWKSCELCIAISDVAETFDVTEATVRAASRKVERFFESKVAVDIASLKTRQHARLEALIESALTDYQKSGGTITTVNRKIRPAIADEGEIVVEEAVIEETVTEKEQNRDPRFINAAMKAMEEQRKLWPGANAPSASTITNAEGTGNPQVNVAHIVKNMTDAEIEALKVVEKLYESEDAIDV